MRNPVDRQNGQAHVVRVAAVSDQRSPLRASAHSDDGSDPPQHSVLNCSGFPLWPVEHCAKALGSRSLPRFRGFVLSGAIQFLVSQSLARRRKGQTGDVEFLKISGAALRAHAAPALGHPQGAGGPAAHVPVNLRPRLPRHSPTKAVTKWTFIQRYQRLGRWGLGLRPGQLRPTGVLPGRSPDASLQCNPAAHPASCH